MNVRITTTTGLGDELEVASADLRAEDLPPWVGHQFEAGADLITISYPADQRTIAYAPLD